jgi:hypothetical protein
MRSERKGKGKDHNKKKKRLFRAQLLRLLKWALKRIFPLWPKYKTNFEGSSPFFFH